MTESELLDRMKNYQFYHTISLTERIQTNGWEAVRPLTSMIMNNLRSLDLRGKRVLDIGCRDGLFSFEAEKMGAAEVIGIDNDPSPAGREFLIPFFRSQVRMVELNVYDLRAETFGKFDVVIFPGVLYHLRYPFWALKLVRDVLNTNGILLLETATYVDDNRLPLLYCPIGADSPYEPTSCTFFNLKALKDTLLSLGLTVRRVECLANHRPPAQRPPRIRERLLAALKSSPSSQPAQQKILLDRAALTCDLTPETMDPNVTRYWDGTHKMHSEFVPATVFRDFKPRQNDSSPNLAAR